ncbi:V-type ATPase assembly factor PKR1 [Aspergillus saccharolyticus JOP 1030-1]|uniref:Putative ER membrane protein n=1 Tax=Aspergillus saccharolyticus JOP 1030-1 TaxID=1450539 RepID=A0A318ZG44_9EURO|nr:putative ER membrane protein [Aspergillus saccharolyticus JOP 1030-1]PYH46521.1 putative ER membrane protein [Aspergillus saccharolyticus JOP 1030-1]
MASFMEDLWSSIFTPGPTPTLLVATNVTFAALQALLLSLLVATYSIHFLVLSFLSGALWWSINWFAREVRQFQAEEAEKQKHADKEQVENTENNPDRSMRKTPGAIDATDSDTETEQVAGRKEAAPVPTSAPQSIAASATLQLPETHGEMRKRLSVSGESSGYQSTDSEWEKVDDNHAA